MTKPLRIIGTDVCLPCAISGHDGDACRANKLEDGGVFCVTCTSISQPISANARAIYQMPMSVKLVVAALLCQDSSIDDDSHPLTATYAQYGPDVLTPDRAAAACAQGNADVVLGAGRVTFATDALAQVVVRFQYDEVKNFNGHAFDKKAPTAEEEDLLAILPHRNCTPTLVAAARKLIEMGFDVLHADLDSSMRRVVLCHTLGANLDRRIPQGIFAEVNYVV
ncbi:MAG: hypothetical protein WC714_18425 [Candidatus Obscuribacterales bacterium]